MKEKKKLDQDYFVVDLDAEKEVKNVKVYDLNNEYELFLALVHMEQVEGKLHKIYRDRLSPGLNDLANRCINELITEFGDYNPELMKKITGKYETLFTYLKEQEC